LFGQAVALHLEGKAEEALAEIERALKAGEQQPEVYAAAGYLYYERKQFPEAAAAYRKLVELQPDSATGWFNLAASLQALEKWEEAASMFERTLAADPNRYEAHLGLGLSRLHLGASRPALEAYERCLRLLPQLEPAKLEPVLLGKAVALQLLKKFPEAAELYARVLEQNPRSEEALANAIAVHLELKDYAAAGHCSEELLKIRGDSRAAHEGLATAAFAAQDYGKAAAHCAALVKVAPDAFEGWFNLGVALEKAGRPDAAKAYSEALRLRPNDADLHLNLGVAYQENGERDKARESYERALQLDANSPTALWNLALVLEQDRKFPDAEKLYVRMLDHAPDAAHAEDARFRLGCLRLELGDFRGAAESFDACLWKRKDWAEALLNAGIANWKLGEVDAAHDAFQRCLAAQPKSTEALRALAAIAVERGHIEEATDLHSKLIENGERSPEFLYNAGLLRQKSGQQEQAVQLYRDAIAALPDFAEALLNLGIALEALGQKEEAKANWQKALALKPELARGYFQ
jgi:tetratricopeptide (TPR) repeat protein